MTTRISLEMSIAQAMVAISDGNPGAIAVCSRILKEGDAIDPQSAGALMAILFLDELEIYGPRIWMLYKDVCGQEINKTMAILRAYQLGFVTRDEINYAIDNRGAGINVDNILAQVKDRLDLFDRVI